MIQPSSGTGCPAVLTRPVRPQSEIIRLKQVDHIMSEKAILQAINHPNVIELLEVRTSHRVYVAPGASNAQRNHHPHVLGV